MVVRLAAALTYAAWCCCCFAAPFLLHCLQLDMAAADATERLVSHSNTWMQLQCSIILMAFVAMAAIAAAISSGYGTALMCACNLKSAADLLYSCVEDEQRQQQQQGHALQPQEQLQGLPVIPTVAGAATSQSAVAHAAAVAAVTIADGDSVVQAADAHNVSGSGADYVNSMCSSAWPPLLPPPPWEQQQHQEWFVSCHPHLTACITDCFAHIQTPARTCWS